MNIDQDLNQEESQFFIRRELEEDLNENERDQEQNEMEYYCDEPSELIDVKYIEDYSREKFFSESQNINNNNIINYDQLYNNNNNNNFILNNYNDMYTNQNYPNFINNDNIYQQNNKNKIFMITKNPKYRDKNKSINKKIFNKEDYNIRSRSKKQTIDWDSIEVPKEKHFHFDRKKHRIVFQRKHLKVLYSIVGLSPPINFKKCYNLIKEQIGDKTLQNYGKGKSFHIIRDNGEEKIVTLKDKKIQLKQNKILMKK